jgi:hypothetical protein
MRTYLGRVLCHIEHEHRRRHGLRGDNKRLLRHKPSPVHLAVVVDLNRHVHLPREPPEPTQLPLFFVKLSRVDLRVLFGQADVGDHQVVLLAAGSVRT